MIEVKEVKGSLKLSASFLACHMCDSPSCFQLYAVQGKYGGLAIKEYHIERKTLQKTHKNGMHIVENILNCRNEM